LLINIIAIIIGINFNLLWYKQIFADKKKISKNNLENLLILLKSWFKTNNQINIKKKNAIFVPMKFKIIFSFILVVFLWSCNQNKIIISGEIEHCDNSYLVLMQILPQKIVMIDTVLFLNGKFSHYIKSEEVGVYLLQFSDDVFLSFIANSGDKLIFSGDAANILKTYNIQGNEETELLIETRRKLDQIYQQTELLSKEFVRYTDNDDFDSIKKIDSAYTALFDTHKAYLADFIRSHPDKLASLMAFYQALGRNAFFSVEEDRELLEVIYVALSKKYPNSIYVKDLAEKLEE